jgi:hypothetical protein
MVVASLEAAVGEALRIPDSKRRAKVVTTITTVARRVSSRPVDLLSAEEFLAEIIRLRRGWLHRVPDAASRQRFLELRRREWRRLCHEPTVLPAGASEKLAELAAAYGENRAIQRQRKAWFAENRDVPQLLLDALGMAPAVSPAQRLERQIRYQLSGQWFFELSNPVTASAGVVWLGPHLDLNRMFGHNSQPHEDWFRFWLIDVRLNNLPTELLIATVEQLQLARPIEIGNSVDQIHAGYLRQCKCVCYCR